MQPSHPRESRAPGATPYGPGRAYSGRRSPVDDKKGANADDDDAAEEYGDEEEELEQEEEEQEQSEGSYNSEDDNTTEVKKRRDATSSDLEAGAAQQINSTQQQHAAVPEEDYTINRRVIAEIIACVLAFVGRGLCMNSLGPTMIDLRQLTSSTIEESAAIFVSQSAGFMVGSFAAKPILNKFNNELALSVLLLLQAIFTALVPTTQILALMCLAFTGQGFAIGVVGIGVTSLCLKLGGPKRNGMFLQAVYLGVSIGSVVGPFMAQPFLSREVHVHGIPGSTSVSTPSVFAHYAAAVTGNAAAASSATPAGALGISAAVHAVSNATHSAWHHSARSTTASSVTDDVEELQINTFLRTFYTQTNVLYAYIVIGLILTLPCMGFLLLYLNRDRTKSYVAPPDRPSDSLAFTNCTTPLFLTVGLLFIQCLIYFGMQDSYSNLLTTYVVLGDLHLHKSRGVYVTSLFWAAVCVGRLNGIWIAKFASPFAMLLGDVICALLCSIALAAFGDSSEHILWAFTFLLGLSFASINAATVAWAAKHVSSNNYLLSLIMVGRCSGLLVVPTVITELLPVVGADALMHALLAVCIMHLACLVGAQVIVVRCGVDGRVYGKRRGEAGGGVEEMKFIRPTAMTATPDGNAKASG